MTMGIAPVTGIPLPFVSVGGSSMIANLLAIGVLQAIHVRGDAPRAQGSSPRQVPLRWSGPTDRRGHGRSDEKPRSCC